MSGSTCEIFDGNNQDLCYQANEFIKNNKTLLISTFADISKHPPEIKPISVFMAGSPGAGKTEFSKRLISELRDDGKINKDPVRIDPDEIRMLIPGYTGDNAYIFQAASAIGVEKLYDHIIAKKQSAIIDGTFSSSKSIQNIERSINKGRVVEIFYLYQHPLLAWEFTKKREALERRNIPKASFIESFFTSKNNVNKVKEIFKDKVKLNLVKHDFDMGFEELYLNIDKVDHHLQMPYSKDELEILIK